MKLASVLTAFVLIILFILFVPPQNIFIIGLFILLISYLAYLILRNFLTKKISILISLFIAASLTLSSLGLFDIINLVLLICLLIGLIVLLK